MNEMKAYVRPERVEDIALALHDNGLDHFTVTHVRSFGLAMDPDDRRMSLEAGEWYTDKAKIEFVCPEPDTDRLMKAIQQAARTGGPGDGVLFVSPVSRAVKIRTGAEGREALS